VSILRTNKSVVPQHSLVVSDTYFELRQAYKAHERALSWETSSHAQLANVCAIEMYNSLIPVLESSGIPSNGLRGAWSKKNDYFICALKRKCQMITSSAR